MTAGKKYGTRDLSCEERLHIIVRRDISHAQRSVQACHALAELLLTSVGREPEILGLWRGRGLVIHGVSGEGDLLRLFKELNGLGGDSCAIFREPDLGGEATAIALVAKTASAAGAGSQIEDLLSKIALL